VPWLVGSGSLIADEHEVGGSVVTFVVRTENGELQLPQC
jgi:hypothetical protein